MMKKLTLVLCCLCSSALIGYAQTDNSTESAAKKQEETGIQSPIPNKDPESIKEAPGQLIKLKVDGHVGPSINNTFTLGTSEMRWKDLFVGPHSLKVGQGNGDQTIISYSNTAGISRTEFDVDD